MRIEFYVEGPSDEAALRNILVHLMPAGCNLRFHVYSGKADLLKALPSRLRGCARSLPPDSRIVVLVDEDGEGCAGLKDRLEQAAEDAGLTTKSGAGQGPFQVLNRIAIEELEAWFFGDVPALRTAYPNVPADLAERPRYRDPDTIQGGTWEQLERVFRKAGYYPFSGMPKVEVARNVSEHMLPDRNTSRSFQVFAEGVRALAVPHEA